MPTDIGEKSFICDDKIKIIILFVQIHYILKQRGRVVWGLDLKSGGSGFKSRSDN